MTQEEFDSAAKYIKLDIESASEFIGNFADVIRVALGSIELLTLACREPVPLDYLHNQILGVESAHNALGILHERLLKAEMGVRKRIEENRNNIQERPNGDPKLN